MRWTLEILVFLVFAGMAVPVVWRMRGLSVLRAALSRKPSYMRVAACVFFAAAVIYGGGKGGGGGNGGGDGGDGGGGDPPLRGGLLNQTLPQWYLDCGYDAADTDGDGIPDCWERWTGTDPLVFDSASDLDDDGLSNLDEFAHQTDPQCADTDNDGFGDAEEIAAASAGISAADPVSPAQFAVSEPDTDGDGIPDVWEDAGAPLFTGVGGDGFPVGIAVPEALPWNYDVLLTITTSRHALLSWGSDAAEKVLLPPCVGQTMRLRLDATDTRTVTLSALPGGTASGAWRGGLSAEWDSRREHPTEGNRIETAFSTFVDKEGEEGVRSEFLSLPGAGLRSGNGGGGIRSLSFLSKPWSMSLLVDSGCATHDPFARVELVEDNVPPPYVWTYVGCETNETTNTVILLSADAFAFDNSIEVGVRQSDGIHSNLCPAAATLVSLGHCMGGATNLAPITSLEGFDAVTNHAPDRKTSLFGNGGSCPDGTNVTIYAGWKHGGDLLERNFETIPTGSDADDLTSHCIATNWTANLEINLEDYLPEILMPHKDELRYRVNGDMIEGTTITAGKKPAELEPKIFHVEMCNEYGATLDRLWITVLNPKTRTEFASWVNNNATNAAWLAQLPKPPSKINVDSLGNASLPSAASTSWNAPEPFPANSYMHPKAVYELRSNAISGGHGHQATYDADGNLITTSIKAGTADYASPANKRHLIRIGEHREEDVKPYIRALQLDGNPVFPINNSGEKSTFWTRNLSRPPLRVGPFTQQYLERRPTTPTGILNIQ
jgi:hypothetical protein